MGALLRFLPGKKMNFWPNSVKKSGNCTVTQKAAHLLVLTGRCLF
jgi:hypothetical protein